MSTDISIMGFPVCFMGCITVVDHDSIRVHLTLSTRFILCGSGSVLWAVLPWWITTASGCTSHCQHASFCVEVVLFYQGARHTVSMLHFVWKWFCFISVHLTLSTCFIL